MSKTVKGYTSITPTGGLLPGNSRPVRFTLLDENGAGVAGEKANITLTVTKGSGSTTVPGSSLTDNGNGTYDYVVTFDEEGYTIGDFIYQSGSIKIRSGWLVYVEERIDTIGELIAAETC